MYMVASGEIILWYLVKYMCLSREKIPFTANVASTATLKNQAITVTSYWARWRQTSNISQTLVGNKIVDQSDLVGASPVGAAPTASSFSTLHLQQIVQRQQQDEMRNI